MKGYEKEPPFFVGGKTAFRIATATHSPSAGSGALSMETLATPPLALTLTSTLTVPFAVDCEPHSITSVLTVATLLEIICRSR